MDLYDNWQEEARSAYLYGIMAASENNVLHKKLFIDLQTAAEKQAKIWEKSLRDKNIVVPLQYHPSLRTRFIAYLVKIIGVENMHPILAAMKLRGMSVFRNNHSEQKHTGFNASNNLRAAVFGINDGLISNMSLILGMAGADVSPHIIFVAGVAGLLAGACSMGAGEYISVRSQREVFEHQIALEKQELEEYPEEEKQELSLIYQARGLPKEDAEKLAKLMIDNPKTGLNTLAREELGINPEDLVSPLGAMIASFLSFSVGAFIPLLPFLFHLTLNTLQISILLTALTLFVIGMILSLFTNRNPLLLGLRMLIVGFIAGGLTFMIGRFLGITLY